MENRRLDAGSQARPWQSSPSSSAVPSSRSQSHDVSTPIPQNFIFPVKAECEIPLFQIKDAWVFSIVAKASGGAQQ
jgi:hypothetical protein